MADISRQELDRLYQTLDDGFRGVHSRLDLQNGRIRTAEIKIALMWLLWVLVGVAVAAVLPDALRRIL